MIELESLATKSAQDEKMCFYSLLISEEVQAFVAIFFKFRTIFDEVCVDDFSRISPSH